MSEVHNVVCPKVKTFNPSLVQYLLPGTAKSTCETCGDEVYISPASMRYIEKHADVCVIMCLDCAKPGLLEELKETGGVNVKVDAAEVNKLMDRMMEGRRFNDKSY